MCKRILLCAVLAASLLTWAGVQAQFAAPCRAELPVSEDDTPFALVPLDQLGVMVVMRQNDLFSSRAERKIYFYDENLALRWETALATESAYSYAGYEIEEDSVRFFLTILPEKNTLPAFLEIAVCMADGAYSKRYHRVDVSELYKAEIESFALHGKQVCFLARTHDSYRQYVFDGATDSLRSGEVISSKEYDLCDAQWDFTTHKAYFLFRDKDLRKQSLYLMAGDMLPAQMHPHVLSAPRSDLRFTDGRILAAGNDVFFVGGTWNTESSKQHTTHYDRGTETAGLFTARYENGRQTAFNLHYYLDFQGADSLMSDEESYKLASVRQRANGRFILPDYLCEIYFWAQDGAFHLLGETYDRLITTTTDVSYDFYGRMMPYTRTSFEGYQYKNAFYTAVDSSGRDVAASVFNIQHVRRESDRAQITAFVQDTVAKKILYAYLSQGMVFYRSIDKESGFTPLRSFRLAPAVPNDRVQRTWSEGILPWYPGCMLSYGYQQIINPRRKGKSRQNVFYMNKLMVERQHEDGRD